jgi:antitoxin component of MazEF toxin-antitoxin module
MPRNKTPAKKPSSTPLQEPLMEYSVRSTFRAVGNSKGIIIPSKLIEASGISGNDLIIAAANGLIAIRELKQTDVNTDLSTWDKQFKSALMKGQEADSDVFPDLKNDFDAEEW